jgi:hypothetical protein
VWLLTTINQYGKNDLFRGPDKKKCRERSECGRSVFPRNEPPCKAANVIKMQPGPKQMAVTHVKDITYFFELFIPDTIQKNHSGLN